MKLKDSEKLIILMLSDLHDEVGLTKVDTKFLRSAIRTDNAWAISWEVPCMKPNHEDVPSEAIDVINYMDMWGVLEESWSRYSEDEKNLVIISSPLGKNARFPGFDRREESKYFEIATLFVEDMGRFQRYKSRDLNSHTPMCKVYARMYKVYEANNSYGELIGILPVDLYVSVFSVLKA